MFVSAAFMQECHIIYRIFEICFVFIRKINLLYLNVFPDIYKLLQNNDVTIIVMSETDAGKIGANIWKNIKLRLKNSFHETKQTPCWTIHGTVTK